MEQMVISIPTGGWPPQFSLISEEDAAELVENQAEGHDFHFVLLDVGASNV